MLYARANAHQLFKESGKTAKKPMCSFEFKVLLFNAKHQPDFVRFDLLQVYGKSWKIRFYDKQDFGGQAAECVEDCPSVYETFKFRELRSCVVMDGAWVLYEQPDYHGHQYFLERGEYPKYTDWGANSPAAGSFRMVTEL